MIASGSRFVPQPASSTTSLLPGTPPRVTVGVADLRATADRGVQVITHALGSCIGVTAWDPRTHATAMLLGTIRTQRRYT